MTTQTQFTHKLDRQALDMRFTKAELYEMIRDQTSYTVTRAMLKQELVGIAWQKVSLLKQDEADRVAAATAIREHELQLAYADENYLETLLTLKTGLDKVIDECKCKSDEFNERANKYGLADAIEWRGESVFTAVEMEGLVAELRDYVYRTRTAEVSEQRRTIAEFEKNISDMIESKTNWLLQSTGFRFNSSSVLANVRSQCKYKAEQLFVKLLKDVREAFKHDMQIEENNPIARYALHLHVYLG